MITKQQAIEAKHGQILHHVNLKGKDKQPMRVRVTGKCRTWKTRPEEFMLPVKYGLYCNGYITPSNADLWELPN